MKLIFRIGFWIFGSLFAVLFILGAYYFAFYSNFFGTLENAGSNVNQSYPDELLQSKIQF